MGIEACLAELLTEKQAPDRGVLRCIKPAACSTYSCIPFSSVSGWEHKMYVAGLSGFLKSKTMTTTKSFVL